MFLHSFPDLNWLKRQAEENFRAGRSWKSDQLPQQGWPSVVLNVETRQTYRDNIRGPLSLFMNLKGESVVEVNGRSNRIRQGFFYLSNQSQHYTLTVDQKTEIETFNIHFGDYLVDQVWQSLTRSENDLLENEFQVPAEPIAFHNRVFRKSESFDHRLMKIKEAEASPMRLEEELSKLIETLLSEEMKLRNIARSLPAIKRATREEIIKRLSCATDLIYATYDRPLTLDEMAAASCLSKFHFLRLFRVAFGKTPGQFLDELRIDKAKEQIRKTDLTIHEIGRNLGFKNASSFSRMFYNQVGVYPSALRTG